VLRGSKALRRHSANARIHGGVNNFLFPSLDNYALRDEALSFGFPPEVFDLVIGQNLTMERGEEHV
jgi:hypothetical protein